MPAIMKARGGQRLRRAERLPDQTRIIYIIYII